MAFAWRYRSLARLEDVQSNFEQFGEEVPFGEAFLGPDSVGTEQLQDFAVTLAKLDVALASGQIIITDSSGVPVYATMTGDVTSDNAGVTAIGALKVTNAMLAGSIALSKLATDPLARANHTGTQTAATVSDFDAQVRTSRVDQLAAPTSQVSLNSQRIVSLANGQANSDAVNLLQLLSYATASQSGFFVKSPVRAATTAALTTTSTTSSTLTNNTATSLVVDGVTLNIGDRVLVKNQATGSFNGLYTVTSDAGGEYGGGAALFGGAGTFGGSTGWVLTRVDAVGVTDSMQSGAYVAVLEGTTNGGDSYALTTVDPIDVGTTAQTWTISIEGDTFSQAAGGDLTGTYPNPTIAAGAVGVDEIATNGVGNAEIATGAVDSDELASNAVTTIKITDANVTDAKLASPNNSAYRTLYENTTAVPAGLGAGTWVLNPDQLNQTFNATNILPVIYFDDADSPVAGLSQKLRLRAQLLCNATAIGTVTLTVGLHAITACAGGAGVTTVTIAAASGNTIAFVTPAASTRHQNVTADFAVPADNYYTLGVTVSVGTTAANSNCQLSAQLQTRNV